MLPHKNLIPIFVPDDNDRAKCPTCGMPVRIVRRPGGFADHYEALITGEAVDKSLPPQDPETAAKLRDQRKGKKTVALVGMAPTSCSLAPFGEEGVEIWGLNEAHAFSWMKGADRWFQIHATESWKRYIAKRDVRGHADWLKNNPFDIPIYLQYYNELVPKSIGYPLHEVVEEVFENFWRGEMKVKYFTSTIAYMMGIAILEKFERIEIYGFEMADDIEYVKQKACAEFWIGVAMGRGIEVYTPQNCQILYSALYGGNEQGAGW